MDIKIVTDQPPPVDLPEGIRVEAPSRQNAEELSIQVAEAEMRQTRKILNADQLVSLKNRRPRFERAYPKLQAFMFTVDGDLNGESVRGALFAGQCILTFGKSFETAHKLAKDGLESTVELIFKDFENQQAAARSTLEHTVIEGREHRGPRLNPHQAAIVEMVMADHLKSKK